MAEVHPHIGALFINKKLTSILDSHKKNLKNLVPVDTIRPSLLVPWRLYTAIGIKALDFWSGGPQRVPSVLFSLFQCCSISSLLFSLSALWSGRPWLLCLLTILCRRPDSHIHSKITFQLMANARFTRLPPRPPFFSPTPSLSYSSSCLTFIVINRIVFSVAICLYFFL